MDNKRMSMKRLQQLLDDDRIILKAWNMDKQFGGEFALIAKLDKEGRELPAETWQITGRQ